MPEPAGYNTAAYAQLGVGSYWVYDGVSIDPNTGNETPNGNRDSIYVARDTIIDGHSYAWLKGERFGVFAFSRFARIDGPRLVAPDGTVWLDVTAQSDTLSAVPGGFPLDSIATVLAAQNLALTINLGPMTSDHTHDLVFYMATGFPSPLHEHEYYVADVGIAVYTSYYASSGVRLEMRLSEYHPEE